MSVITAYSSMTVVPEAIAQIRHQFTGIDPKFIIYFASSNYLPQQISIAMQEAFPEAITIGCSTAGEITTGLMLKNSLVAMAFAEDVIDDIYIQVVEDIQNNTNEKLKQAFSVFSSHFQVPAIEMDPTQYVGMVLFDGLSCMEEQVNDQLGNYTNVLFVGGSAGDDLKFEKTFVFADGKTFNNAVVLAILKPKVVFDIIKTQSFTQTGKVLQATSVDENNRTITEFDHRPAIQAYADAIGQNKEEASNSFMQYPTGLMIDGEPFVRSPQQTKGDSIVFYCSIKEGMQLEVLEAQNMIPDTAEAISVKEKSLNGIQALVVFNCILRTLQLENEGLTEAYGQVFKLPTVGFSTYGESMIGHMNQTATMLAFGRHK
ncbi:MAG: FIST N-terminal domain-containing protein [Syntrophomonas sp.]